MESDISEQFAVYEYKEKEIKKGNNGIKLSDFEIVKLLGKNNFSSLYLVKSNSTNKKYAMKEIRTEIYNNEIQLLAIQKEIKLLENINHPHLTTYFSSFNEKGNFFILIEYFEGESLDSFFQKIKDKGNYVQEKKIWDFLLQALSGLSYLHNTEKIIHRNIKPSNILIDKNGIIKITDYGISALYREDLNNNINTNLTTINTFKYIKYSSPEIIQGGIYDFKSDIYMLGLTFYNLMSDGQKNTLPDYYGKDIKKLLNSLLNDDINERPSSKNAFIEAIFPYSYKYLGFTSILSVLKCFFAIKNIETYFKSDKVKELITSEKEKEDHLLTKYVRKALDLINSYNFNCDDANIQCLTIRLYIYLKNEKLCKIHEISSTKFIEDLCKNLHNELNKYNNNIEPGSNIINEEYLVNKKEAYDEGNEIKVIESACKKFQEKYRSKISEQFYFLIKTTYKCLECNNKIKITTNFFCMFYTFPDIAAYTLNKKILKVNDLFEHILKLRLYEDTNIKCKYCNKTQDKVIMFKKLYFSPKNLIISFDYSTNYKFQFQLEEFIDISSFAERKDINKAKYRLIGAIFIEQIEDEPKKYVSYTKETNGQWKYFSGNYISDSDLNEIKNHENVQALFYTSLD